MGRGFKKTRVIKRGEWDIFEREKIALFKKNQSYSYKQYEHFSDFEKIILP